MNREFIPNELGNEPGPEEVPTLSLIAADGKVESKHADTLRILMGRALVFRDEHSTLRLTEKGALALYDLGLPFGESGEDDKWAVCPTHGIPTGKDYGSGKPLPCRVCKEIRQNAYSETLRF